MNKLMIAVFAACVVAASCQAKSSEVIQPNTAVGYIAVVNNQTKVSESNIVAATMSVREVCCVDFRFFKTVEEAKGSKVMIRIVDDPSKPPMCAAPEAGWAILNVAPIDADLTTPSAKARFLPERTRKMFLRAFAYAAGAGGSGYPKNVLDTVTLRDLDYVKETLPLDAVDAARRHLRKRGISPARVVPYPIACEEGWAPEPANEKQKAIAAKIKAAQSAQPTKGLEIKFDPKKGK